jgi:cell division control protein 45
MDLTLRTEVGSLFEEKSEKYGLEDIMYGSFTANFGFRNKFCAADIVYACLALMEQHQGPIL